MAIIYGDNNNNTLKGTLGNDVIYGLGGNDWLASINSGNDQLVGGAGNDNYQVDSSLDVISENANEGVEWVFSRSDTYVLPSNVENIKLEVHALHGIGNNLNNSMEGSQETNILSGKGGNDGIWGFGGNDQIYGEIGNDRLYGGLGKDHLYGGSGADKFSYEYNVILGNILIESPVGAGRDVIHDFSHYEEDKINLSSIDADLTLPGDQAFTQGSYVNGILTADVIGGDDIQIELTGAPYLDLDYDIIL